MISGAAHQAVKAGHPGVVDRVHAVAHDLGVTRASSATGMSAVPAVITRIRPRARGKRFFSTVTQRARSWLDRLPMDLLDGAEGDGVGTGGQEAVRAVQEWRRANGVMSWGASPGRRSPRGSRSGAPGGSPTRALGRVWKGRIFSSRIAVLDRGALRATFSRSRRNVVLASWASPGRFPLDYAAAAGPSPGHHEPPRGPRPATGRSTIPPRGGASPVRRSSAPLSVPETEIRVV